MPSKYTGYEFYEQVLGSPKRILAPMVDQSELAWRMLSRKYGADLCFTPMWHAGIFVRDGNYRNDALHSCAEDRPLVLQFCANDPNTFLEAALLAEPHVDAVDLNLGCPQIIARRGHYGSYLQDEWDLLFKMVSLASEKLSIPVTVKIRVFEEIDKTIKYAKMLENAGAKIITVHGRTREQKGALTSIASWDHIKAVKDNVSIPVFANGNIQYGTDIDKCIECTGVDGVMAAEGSLSNPAIFRNLAPPTWEMAEEYLDCVVKYTPSLKSRAHLSYIRGHLFRIWFHVLAKHLEYRDKLGKARTFEVMKEVSETLKLLCLKDAQSDKEEGRDSTEPGKLPYWRCQPYIRPEPKPDQLKKVAGVAKKEEEKVPRLPSCKEIKRKERKAKFITEKKVGKYILCTICDANPKGTRCTHKLCKKCCRAKSSAEILDCAGHFYRFKTNAIKNKNRQETECNQVESCRQPAEESQVT